VQADAAAQPVLTTRGVVLARSGRRIASLPDLAVAPGQAVALLGPSGSGKSTALMALAGIRAPDSGDIEVGGIRLWALPSAARDRFRGHRIGLVFQSFHLIDALSVAANVAIAMRCAGLSPDHGRVDSLLQGLQLAALARRRADRISHGQAQRVAMARALVNRPAVVLADEPTSALDDAATAELLALLRQSARAEGAGLLIATHDRRVIAAVDQVVEMKAAA